MENDKRQRRLDKLEAKQKRMHEHLERMRQRMDDRFERARQRIASDQRNPSEAQQRIIDAALELLNEEGLNDLSLRKLAKKLEFQASALYWHFKSKEVLIDYMAEAILRNEFADLQPRSPDEAWQDWLTHVALRLRTAMLRYRDGGRVIAGTHVTPAMGLLYIIEISLASLVSAGVPLDRASLVVHTAFVFVLGEVIEEQLSPSPRENAQFDFDALRKNYPLVAESLQRRMEKPGKAYGEFEDALRLIIGYPG